MNIEIPNSLIKRGFELVKSNPDGELYICFCNVDGYYINPYPYDAVARIYSEGGNVKMAFCEEIILTQEAIDNME